MAIGGSKNKSKSSGSTTQNQSFNQTQTSSLSPRAFDMLSGRMQEVGERQYQRLDPNAYQDYMNPFQDEVIDATTADINANRDLAANQQRSDLGKAGAFGDKRRGIMEAELTGQYDRTLATTLAGLRSRGFSEATGVAQGENTNMNQFDANTQAQINQLLSLLANERTTTSSGSSSGAGTSRGSQSGYNMGFSWTPSGGFG